MPTLSACVPESDTSTLAMRSKILVTGAGGFVGRSLVARLSRQEPGAEIVALGRHTASPSGAVTCQHVDVCTDELVEAVKAFCPTHIVHLAAKSSVAAALNAAAETSEVAVQSAVKLSEAVRRHAPGATVLLASSGEVYGRAFLAETPLDEMSPIAPANPYARSKVASEVILTDQIGSDARLIIARPLNHTGRDQDVRFVVPSFALQIAEIEAGWREPVVKVGNLAARRDFLAIGDVVDAYVGLLNTPQTSSCEIYNISSETLRSIGSVLDDLRALSNRPVSVEVEPARLRAIEVPETKLSSGKLRALTGWSPSIPWSQVLLDVLDAARLHVAQPA